LCQEQGKDPLDYRQREQADEAFQKALKANEHPKWKQRAYWQLKDLRNAMAHGTTSEKNASVQELQRNPQRLREELRSALSRLSQP
jgi:DNA polymerase III delta subunit